MFGTLGSAARRSGAPSAKSSTVSNSQTGVVYTVSRLLGTSSTLSLSAGSNGNLALNGAAGTISATAAIGAGASQKAYIRESAGDLAVEYTVTLIGAAVTPTPTPSGALRLSGDIAYVGKPFNAQVLNNTYADQNAFDGGMLSATAVGGNNPAIFPNARDSFAGAGAGQKFPIFSFVPSAVGTSTAQVTDTSSGSSVLSSMPITVRALPAPATAAGALSSAQKIVAAAAAKKTIILAPNPPTITQASGAGVSLVNGRTWTQGGSTATSSVPDASPVPAMTTTASLGNIYGNSYPQATTQWAFAQGFAKRFSFTGRQFDFKATKGVNTTGSWRMRFANLADGTWYWATPSDLFLGADGYTLVDLGSTANWGVELIFGEGITGYGFNFENGVVPQPLSIGVGGIRIAMFNDSYTFGTGADSVATSLARLAVETVGVYEVLAQGHRTSGYMRVGGTQGRQVLPMDRIINNGVRNELMAYGPLDAALVNASINDFTLSAYKNEGAAYNYGRNNVALMLRRMRDQMPGMPIAVTLGMYPPNFVMPATIRSIWVDAFDDVFANDAAAILIDGDAGQYRRKGAISAMPGGGPWVPAGAVGSSPYFPPSGDTDHPIQPGHSFFGPQIGNGLLWLCQAIVDEAGTDTTPYRVTSTGDQRVTSDGDLRRTA